MLRFVCILLPCGIEPYTSIVLAFSASGEKNQQSLERIFLFCLMWAFGGALTSDKQIDFKKTFSAFFKTLCNKVISFPEHGTESIVAFAPFSND